MSHSECFMSHSNEYVALSTLLTCCLLPPKAAA